MTNVADLADALEVKVLAVNAYAFSNEVVGDGEKVKTLCETADLMKEAAKLLRDEVDWARRWTVSHGAETETPFGWMKRALEAEDRLESLGRSRRSPHVAPDA